MKVKLWCPEGEGRPAALVLQPETHEEWIIMRRVAQMKHNGKLEVSPSAPEDHDHSFDGALMFDLYTGSGNPV
jgi:hypothetical protein